MIATGSRAFLPDIAGNDLSNIFTLRSLADAITISDAAGDAKTVAVIGAGFIGLEAAAFLTKRGLKATVISPEPLPLAKRFGDDVAKAIKIYHRKQRHYLPRGGSEELFRHRRGGGSGARGWPADRDRFRARGRRRQTRDGPDRRDRDCGTMAASRSTMRFASPRDVWLAGDIAAFPEVRSGTEARIEHWRLAEQHGAHVAKSILGAPAPFRGAPFFWSNQGDKRLDYAGYGAGLGPHTCRRRCRGARFYRLLHQGTTKRSPPARSVIIPRRSRFSIASTAVPRPPPTHSAVDIRETV